MNKIPITVGIIGHIDAIITDKHRDKIRSIFNDITEKYPTSPIVLFSQLALGSDTEVANYFLELKEEYKRDYRLVVPIPYNIETYKKTQFETTEQLNHFNDLLKKAERFFELTDDREDKNEYYKQAGEFVANSSMILIALWDENNNGKIGGTAGTVQYKKFGSYNNKITKHIFDTKGALISIPCNRRSTKNPKDIVLKNNFLQKLLNENNSIKKALDKVDFLNTQTTDADEAELKKSGGYLYQSTVKLNQNAVLLRDYFAIADIQSNKNHKKY
jgi:hypothetical protein